MKKILILAILVIALVSIKVKAQNDAYASLQKISILLPSGSSAKSSIEERNKQILQKEIEKSSTKKELKKLYIFSSGENRHNAFIKLLGLCNDFKSIKKLIRFIKRINNSDYRGPEFNEIAIKVLQPNFLK